MLYEPTVIVGGTGIGIYDGIILYILLAIINYFVLILSAQRETIPLFFPPFFPCLFLFNFQIFEFLPRFVVC